MGGVGRGHSQAGAWLWELQHQVSLEESQHLGDRMAVSGVLSYKGGEREGRKEKGVPGEFQREREWFPPSEVGEQI